MSCVVGLVHEGTVIMGADGMSTAGAEGAICDTAAEPKLWRFDAAMLAGASGNTHAIQAIRYAFERPVDERDDPFVYLTRDFVPAMRRHLAAHGIAQSEIDGDAFTLLIGYRGRLFTVASRGDVHESSGGYDGVGYCRAALGVLSIGEELTGPPERRVRLALVAESRYSTFVGPPFIVESLAPVLPRAP